MIPANIELSGMEVSLVNIMSRELVLKQYIERMREEYDYILIDCMPSLGMLTINALASVDAVIIPVQAAYLPVKGLEQLIRTIGKVRRQLNKQLKIGGILITMVDNRTNYARDISDLIFDTYGNQIKIFAGKKYMDVDDVCAILGVSKTYAYSLMREYNKELKAKGYIVAAGKISTKFLTEKIYGMKVED